jgi:hypothetical protein
VSTSAVLAATSVLIPPVAEIAAGRLATPATLKGAAAVGARWAWAPTRLYTSATPAQRAIGRALATAFGTSDFDDENWVCIGRGRPIGESIVAIVAIEAEAEFTGPFKAVDRNRGDTLLALGWPLDPPLEWFH